MRRIVTKRSNELKATKKEKKYLTKSINYLAQCNEQRGQHQSFTAFMSLILTKDKFNPNKRQKIQAKGQNSVEKYSQ